MHSLETIKSLNSRPVAKIVDHASFGSHWNFTSQGVILHSAAFRSTVCLTDADSIADFKALRTRKLKQRWIDAFFAHGGNDEGATRAANDACAVKLKPTWRNVERVCTARGFTIYANAPAVGGGYHLKATRHEASPAALESLRARFVSVVSRVSRNNYQLTIQ